MILSQDTFIKKYVECIRNQKAAVFAGAGLSRASGFVDWKNLVKPLAEEINLDVEKEDDLLAVAQYYKNCFFSTAGISNRILDAFNHATEHNENISILARLPISTFWTTNYDKLIETALSERKKVDVKYNSDHLAITLKDRDAIVYKMHGCVSDPSHTVLTKDDYVFYEKNRPLFREVLKSDLMEKSFLFIGFSFNDPNIDYVLGQIYASLGKEVPEHYCIFRAVQNGDYSDDETYEYEKRKQELRVTDLSRYGIQTVFIDDYTEITDILKRIESAVKKENIFISGSAAEYGCWSRYNAELFAKNMSAALVTEGYQITSGFGVGIGSSVINGALEAIYSNKKGSVNNNLHLFPFPQGIKDEKERERLFSKYRNDMIRDTGIAIFMFGNKFDPKDASKIIDAPGCWKEFEVAKANDNTIIPIGSTGFATRKILEEIKANISEYPYLEAYISILESETEIDILVSTVLEIIKKQQNA